MLPDPGLVAAVNRGVKKADRRGRGLFDGLHGSLPQGAAILLEDIVSYLREFLLDEKGLSKKTIHRLLAEEAPRGAFRAASRELDEELEDDAVRIALGILNSVRSALTARDNQVESGFPQLSSEEITSLLLSGRDGLRGARVKKGGGRRGADVQKEQTQRRDKMQLAMDDFARRFPRETHRQLATRVARLIGCHERTVRRRTQNPRPKARRGMTS